MGGDSFFHRGRGRAANSNSTATKWCERGARFGGDCPSRAGNRDRSRPRNPLARFSVGAIRCGRRRPARWQPRKRGRICFGRKKKRCCRAAKRLPGDRRPRPRRRRKKRSPMRVKVPRARPAACLKPSAARKNANGSGGKDRLIIRCGPKTAPEGWAHSRTLPRSRGGFVVAPASWSAAALCRFRASVRARSNIQHRETRQ